MGNIIYIDRRDVRKPLYSTPTNLLPPIPDGFKKIRITCTVMRNFMGNYGYTDFQEITPGYVIAFFPKLGYVDLCKDTFVEAEDV